MCGLYSKVRHDAPRSATQICRVDEIFRVMDAPGARVKLSPMKTA
jgi:hypothetical protein